MAASEELRRKREELVIEHMETENRHEYEATIETFDHPRYELVGTGDVYDGREEVARYFEETRTAFPDQRNELLAPHHADTAEIEEDRLVCERVYFDSNTVLRQLGIARDPLSVGGRVATVLNHPLTVGRAVTRQVVRR